MQIRAAVVEKAGGPFRITTLELEDPRPDEVLVRVVAAGVCRTDLHIRDQEYPVPSFPVVAGHESTGVVESVGADVPGIRPGDHVIASYPSCGTCAACLSGRLPYCRDGFRLSFGGSRLDGSSALRTLDGTPVNGHVFQQSSFATHAIVHRRNLVVLPSSVTDLALLAPLGCGVQTGAGTVLQALRVRSGSTVAVWGTGSVGLSAVMAAATAGARIVAALDTDPARLDLARRLGATHVVDPTATDPVAQLLAWEPDGIEFAIDTTGSPAVLADALRAIRMTGELALVGAAPAGTTSSIDMGVLLNGRRMRGVIQGDAVPQRFLPELVRLHRRGRLPIEQLVAYYDFEDIERAVADMSAGAVIKPVLRMSAP
ncbi:hypothetical protein BJF78_07255 [Pseudonocardia sp. CNS-139]|nr:hypothetical protein BJF78_07255 [Pseudonocardia sp. CNS-139]